MCQSKRNKYPVFKESVSYTIILPKSVCLSVAIRSLQAAVTARSSREILKTVRIDCLSFLSHDGVSIRHIGIFV